MVIKKNVHSSNLTFKQLVVDVDTVFYRFNEKKWIKIDEETKEEAHVGWVYDEIWYEKDEFIENLSGENQQLKEDLEKAKQKDLMSSFAVIQLDSKILELEEKLNEFSK